jgi:magnesium-protoporphyrin IX monomethyl ester (oxidative) cyclase
LNLDDPRFRRGLERLRRIARSSAAAAARGGIIGALTRAGCAGAAALTFARLYLLPVRQHKLPVNVRMAPAW